jgi:general nucleoside transport system permease protein
MQGAAELGWWGVLIAVIGGAIRVSTPYLFVSLGETLTETCGRVNLGLEGTLVLGAMSGYATSWATGSPWLGVFVAGLVGALFGLLHGAVCGLPRVNDIAVGIALFLLGTGLAFYLGKPYTISVAPRLPHIALGAWSSAPQIRSALEINALFIIGMILAPLLGWGLRNTRWGLVARTVGDNADAARTLGFSVERARVLGAMAGGFLAGVGGSFLSLYYPGTWNEGLSSGQGLMAVTLVIFARWSPVACFYTSLLFGGATALGPALQSVGITTNYYLYGAAPYILTLALLIWSSSTKHTLVGAPSELTISK